jgi:transcriptional regulator with XRE-family HTH domain
MNSDKLAELIGLSRYAIMHYENNQTEPKLEDLKKMASVLDIEVDMLYDDYYRFLDYPYYVKMKEFRIERGLLQREFGAILGVGRRTVERWEHGRNEVTRERWEQFKHLRFL